MRVAVVGATGYAGQEAVQWIRRHPQMSLSAVVSAHEAGHSTASYFGAGSDVPGKFTAPNDLSYVSCDVIFACQAPGQLTGAMAEWIQWGVRVVDLSADFRFGQVAQYEMYYGPHQRPELIAQSVTGYADDPYMQYPAQAAIIGNPGCYPTAFFSAVGPLARAQMITGPIIVDGKSGLSGAGRAPKTHLMLAEMVENVEAYNHPGQHRHTPEMENVAGRSVMFQPHYMPMARGMELSIYLPHAAVSPAQVVAQWENFYADTSFVRIVREQDGYPRTGRVRGTNQVELGVRFDTRTDTMVLYSAIDNLAKGAATQAIQHVNRWMGWDPAIGLW